MDILSKVEVRKASRLLDKNADRCPRLDHRYPVFAAVAANRLGGRANVTANTVMGLAIGVTAGFSSMYFRSAERITKAGSK